MKPRMNVSMHLDLLTRWDRAAGLPQAIGHLVKPGMRVLDTGCGTGLLTLLALKAGAEHVTAVDLGNVDLARALVAENGMGDRVSFLEADLSELTELPGAPFDAMLGMIYFSDPRRDEFQSRLAMRLIDRFVGPGRDCMPTHVRYVGYPCDWPEQDAATRLADWQQRAAHCERRYGLRFGALVEALREGAPALQWFPRRLETGELERPGARLLGPPVAFGEVDYRAGRLARDSHLELEVRHGGSLNTVLWRQELSVDHVLLFLNESVSWVEGPPLAEPGARYRLALDDDWRATNVLRDVVRVPVG